ncbi:DUF6716 putative glycosyltransferase [Aeromicrobium sp. Root472D3]|uniref:DUF6716 putative glycosyltransferase n=1 Tax=Aeromicrobium sp. Root472D3 TaxID=1736540 RepID=UPI000701B204|nr:DUF6716 putative glycosyltransferase [Aeromicrobium sp. Root472D3]KQX75220.1 hypothetical protein ASD10_08555 [Aeromicrobium sp. Root472D3]
MTQDVPATSTARSAAPAPPPPRALFVTDSDSYVKWGAALAGQVPDDWAVRLVVLRGNAEPSARQVVEALAGTRFVAPDVERADRAGLIDLLTTWHPDVVVAAARGMAVESLGALLAETGGRPVVVSGLAGISIPVLAPGLRYRRCADVFVLQSRRELREFTAVDQHHRFELTTIPYLVGRDGPAIEPDGPAVVRDRIVFAAQAMVPASRRDRLWMLERLVETAWAHPHLTVVVKVRARDGEPQTHVEQFPYEDLLVGLAEAGTRLPPNLTVEGGAMGRHLRRAVGLATISSTALLEAVAQGVPCLAIDDFGVGHRQINTVLVGSGLLGPTSRLVAADFRHPAPEWLDDNYLHDPAENTWVAAVEELLARRSRGELPPLPRRSRSPVRRTRAAVLERLSFVPPRDRAAGLHRAFLLAGFWEHRRRWAVRPGEPRAPGRRRVADDGAPTSRTPS